MERFEIRMERFEISIIRKFFGRLDYKRISGVLVRRGFDVLVFLYGRIVRGGYRGRTEGGVVFRGLN